jgi:hypothetical protein
MWPQLLAGDDGAHVKDRVEAALREQVCAGTLALADAQARIAIDWTTACGSEP